MRALLLETLAVAAASLVFVCLALAALPADEAGTWADRAIYFLRVACTLDFQGALWAQPTAFAFVARAAGISLAIIAAATALLVAIGVPLGIACVTRSESALVRTVRRALDVVTSVPVLVYGTLLWVLAARLGTTLREDTAFASAMAAAVLVLLLGDRVLADIVQRVEIATRSILAEPYMRTVRAGGLGVSRHLLQGLVPPVAETLAARSAFLISGAIVAELLFYLHGLGFTVHYALWYHRNDLREILAAAMALLAVAMVFRFTARAAVLWADARLRTGMRVS